MKNLVGQTFGEYRLVKHIGSGGMAHVFLAEQATLNRSAAVKVLKPALMQSSGERVVSRFRQEAMTAAALSHPNIVQVYTIGVEGDYHFIAQEYVRGHDLATILRTQGPPALPAALQIMKQMAAALAAAGKAGIVHRDIKPDNVLVDQKGIVKIADFGLAQLQDNFGDGGLTQEGSTLGTPLYMSPEQVRAEDLDQRSDIYSLGITFYQLLSGRTPFGGRTATGIAVQHVTTMPPPLAEEKPDLPDVICRMVHCMIAKRRSHRYQTAADILTDVKELQTALRQKRSLDLVRLPELSRIENLKNDVDDAATAGAATSEVESAGVAATVDVVKVQPARPLRMPTGRSAAADDDSERWVSLPSWEESDDGELGPRRRRPVLEEMDLTPMVDVTFLLLIFFMITAAFDLQKKFDVAASRSDEASRVTIVEDLNDQAVKVEIGHDNIVYIGEQEAETYEEIRDLLAAARNENSELELQIRIDPESRHEMRIRVNDAGAQAGFTRIRSVSGAVN